MTVFFCYKVSIDFGSAHEVVHVGSRIRLGLLYFTIYGMYREHDCSFLNLTVDITCICCSFITF